MLGWTGLDRQSAPQQPTSLLDYRVAFKGPGLCDAAQARVVRLQADQAVRSRNRMHTTDAVEQDSATPFAALAAMATNVVGWRRSILAEHLLIR